MDPFFAEGLSQGDKQVHIIEPPNLALHIARLQEAGMDVDGAIARGQLELLPWKKLYLADGHFDQQALIERIQQALDRCSMEGYARTRLIGHMTWALDDRAGSHGLAEYEARVNDMSVNFDDVLVCVYDLTHFSGSVIADVLRSHPAIIIGGAVRDNSFYVPPDQLLAELRQRGNH